MEQRIVEFAEVLRQNGLRVSVGEVEDAARAMAFVGLLERELTRAALRITLCKRAGDVATFDRAFDFFFSGASRMLEGLDRSLAKRLEEEGLLEGDELEMIVAMLGSLAGQLAPLTQAALAGDRAALAGLLRRASLEIDFSRLENALQAGFYSRRLLSAAGVEAMRSDLAALAAELAARGLDGRGLEVVSRHLSQALRRVEDAARAEVKRAGRRAALADRPRARRQAAGTARPRRRRAVVTRAVRALAEKLKARLVRRRRSRRRAAQPPAYAAARTSRPAACPWCPSFAAVAPSAPTWSCCATCRTRCATTSRMMLLFTWTLQSLFARVRSFVFVSELGEMTRHFKDAKPEEAVDARHRQRRHLAVVELQLRPRAGQFARGSPGQRHPAHHRAW